LFMGMAVFMVVFHMFSDVAKIKITKSNLTVAELDWQQSGLEILEAARVAAMKSASDLSEAAQDAADWTAAQYSDWNAGNWTATATSTEAAEAENSMLKARLAEVEKQLEAFTTGGGTGTIRADSSIATTVTENTNTATATESSPKEESPKETNKQESEITVETPPASEEPATEEKQKENTGKKNNRRRRGKRGKKEKKEETSTTTTTETTTSTSDASSSESTATSIGEAAANVMSFFQSASSAATTAVTSVGGGTSIAANPSSDLYGKSKTPLDWYGKHAQIRQSHAQQGLKRMEQNKVFEMPMEVITRNAVLGKGFPRHWAPCALERILQRKRAKGEPAHLNMVVVGGSSSSRPGVDCRLPTNSTNRKDGRYSNQLEYRFQVEKEINEKSGRKVPPGTLSGSVINRAQGGTCSVTNAILLDNMIDPYTTDVIIWEFLINGTYENSTK